VQLLWLLSRLVGAYVILTVTEPLGVGYKTAARIEPESTTRCLWLLPLWSTSSEPKKSRRSSPAVPFRLQIVYVTGMIEYSALLPYGFLV
jgi:hypothetical protein